ncbi:docking protein 1b [Boleophthalmus pectinirostris]|uniref:docking protein 1b n=1 Tax=Boleophthalmus pectinirostris TaxID=150288 RepID=UPI0024319C03|nr:docking protein 1b [Boleophthalmus pectinirostris]
MDAHVKEGQLYVQHQKFGKKWKKNWFVLYPASQNGIARLEFFDSSGSGGGFSGGSGANEKTRKLDKKIIRLSECISILPALTENCPKDNMSAFCVETNDKTHVFCAERATAKEWMDTMCDIAFQGGGGSAAPEPSPPAPDLQMSENLIYYSREEVDEFWVSVQRTEASERCGLAGSYWLKAESDVLILKEPKTKRTVQVWPYKLLRRYGRDRVMFSFEAGRRCDSGPGNFTFDTKQGNEIFSLVDQAIRSQKALAEERRLSCNQEEGPSSLPFLRSGDNSSTSSREADGDSGGSKPGSADGVLSRREGAEGGAKAATVNTLKGRGLPDTPAMLGTPPRSPRGRAAGGGDEQTGLYSEPADCVRPLQANDSLYSDPVDSIKAQGPAPSTSTTPDLYSYVYDHITMDMSHKTSALSLNGAAKSTAAGQEAVLHEHIYDEPEGCAKSTLPKTIYNEATAPSMGTGRALLKGPKWAKPLTAPKPARGARKEPVPPSGKFSNVNNNNSVRAGGSGELYSRVSKRRSCYSQQQQRAERRPDLIYDNLGDI